MLDRLIEKEPLRILGCLGNERVKGATTHARQNLCRFSHKSWLIRLAAVTLRRKVGGVRFDQKQVGRNAFCDLS